MELQGNTRVANFPINLREPLKGNSFFKIPSPTLEFGGMQTYNSWVEIKLTEFIRKTTFTQVGRMNSLDAVPHFYYEMIRELADRF